MSTGPGEPAFEDRVEVGEAIQDDTTAPGLAPPDPGPPQDDPATPTFQEPGAPPRTV